MIRDGVRITSLGRIFFSKSHIKHFSLDDGFAQVWPGLHDGWVPTLGPLELELSIEIRLKKKT